MDRSTNKAGNATASKEEEEEEEEEEYAWWPDPWRRNIYGEDTSSRT